MNLPDVLQAGLRVVFVGTAPSRTSARVGAYYGNPRNRFYRVLHEVGLTPRLLDPTEYRTLPRYGIGLTDVNKVSVGVDAILPRDTFDREGFLRKVMNFEPRIVGFTSKRAAREGTGRTFPFGEQGYWIGESRVWVLPSPSPRAAWNWDARPWERLAEVLAEAGEGDR